MRNSPSRLAKAGYGDAFFQSAESKRHYVYKGRDHRSYTVYTVYLNGKLYWPACQIPKCSNHNPWVRRSFPPSKAPEQPHRGLFIVVSIMKFEWGNIPQWISALCAILLAALAIYGGFFSSTGHALVSYLQSELTARNQRIAGLEQREAQLQASINAARTGLSGIREQKSSLERQIASLKGEQQTLTSQIQSMHSDLSKKTFDYVREKISVQLTAGLGELYVVALRLSDEVSRPGGTRARTLRPFEIQTRRIEEISKKLPDAEKETAQLVMEKFSEQCSRFRTLAISIPSVRIPDGELAQHNYDQDKTSAGAKIDAISKHITKAAEDLDRCFHSVIP